MRKNVSLARVALAVGDAEGALRLLRARGVETETLHVRAEHAALTVAALALEQAPALSSRPDSEGAPGASIDRLAAYLDAHDGLLALALVPTNALRALRAQGAVPLPASLIARIDEAVAAELIPAAARRPVLTPREAAVAAELARAETVAQIAAALVVSPNTVKTQLRSLYRKLGVANRADALRALAAAGVIDTLDERD